jgi:hypothetical protein
MRAARWAAWPVQKVTLWPQGLAIDREKAMNTQPRIVSVY